jgi:spondin-1
LKVSWRAPPAKSGCVIFKSTVIVKRDIWYSDDGALSKILCEDDSDSGDIMTEPLEKCDACEEAKYELTFEGLWTRHTHPKDFPNGWLTRFSDIIGASHSVNYTLWKQGKDATKGLAYLTQHTSTLELENELKEAVRFVGVFCHD